MSHLNYQLRSLWTEPASGRRLPLYDPYSRPYIPSYEPTDIEAGERQAEHDGIPDPHANRKWTDFYLAQGFSQQESRILAHQICGSAHGKLGALPLDVPARNPASLARTRTALGTLIRRES